MGKPNPKSNQAKTNVPRTRGLSQRLRRPLSIESNVPEPEIAPSPVAAKNVAATKMVPSTSDAPAEVGQTRQVSASKSGARQEGMLQAGQQLQNRYKILGIIGIGYGVVLKLRKRHRIKHGTQGDKENLLEYIRRASKKARSF